MTLTELAKALEKAKAREARLVERYNREYSEGRWTTNRPLAGACEDAFDAVVRAEITLKDALFLTSLTIGDTDGLPLRNGKEMP